MCRVCVVWIFNVLVFLVLLSVFNVPCICVSMFVPYFAFVRLCQCKKGHASGNCKQLKSVTPRTCIYQNTFRYSDGFLSNFHLELTTGYNGSQKCFRQGLTCKRSTHSCSSSAVRQERRYCACWADVLQQVVDNTLFIHSCMSQYALQHVGLTTLDISSN